MFHCSSVRHIEFLFTTKDLPDEGLRQGSTGSMAPSNPQSPSARRIRKGWIGCHNGIMCCADATGTARSPLMRRRSEVASPLREDRLTQAWRESR